jgi:sterol desaturase/sphingolipid hydroxylase (fatty acid hydroxylase superfamily)
MTHHRHETCNFGVTTGIWDVLFRTGASFADGRAAGVCASE